MWRSVLGRVAKVMVAVVVIALLAGHVLGQPVLLSYVETGSMAPTLEPGDGFVAVPDAVAGEPEEGDVVVFRAREVGSGGLTTHRIVDERADGYVTRGDANTFSDQDSGEPLVRDPQVVAHALQINGEVVVIPHLGTAKEGIAGALTGVQTTIASLLGTRSLLGAQGLGYLLLAISVLAYLADVLFAERSGRERTLDRSIGRTGASTDQLLLIGVTTLVVLLTTATMVVPAGTHEVDYISAEFESDRPDVIERGTTVEQPFGIPNGGHLPVVSYLETETEDIAIDRSTVTIAGNGKERISIRIDAPDETGQQRAYVTEHRYLHVLPRPVLHWLYTIHPWLPILVIDLLAGGLVYGTGRLLQPRDRVRTRRTTAKRPDGLLS